MTPLERFRIEKAGADCGFELTPHVKNDSSMLLRSAMFPETVSIAVADDEVFRLQASTAGLLDILGGDDSLTICGFEALYAALRRASAMARTMPNRVADRFRQEKANLPTTTEAERLVIQRVGQDLFRGALLDYWEGQCCVTGLSVPSLLRASHIKPWAKCATDDERLDVFNGLLLAPHLDALFDGGWISFADDGALLLSQALSKDAYAQLGVSEEWRVEGLQPRHLKYLEFHRQFELRRLARGHRPGLLTGNE